MPIAVTELIGTIVISSGVTATVTLFIKEKFTKKKDNGPVKNCPLHSGMEFRLNSGEEKFYEIKDDIKGLNESYVAIDKKLEVFMATEALRTKKIEECLKLFKGEGR